MIGSTSKFKVESILFNDGSFAIASGYWDGKKDLSVACRWHKEGIGYPQTYGKPQWMVLPETKVEPGGSGDFGGPAIKLGFGVKKPPFYNLQLIDEGTGEMVHSIEADHPFGPITQGDYMSVPQASFPDELPSPKGRKVTRVQHIVNQVDGAIWHSCMVTLATP